MKRVSDKRRELLREATPLREAYQREFPKCQWPGCAKLGQQVHEIARGIYRAAALIERCCWLHLCQEHHREIHNGGVSIERQLRWKLLADKHGYDLQKFCRIRGRSQWAITQKEVDDSEVGER